MASIRHDRRRAYFARRKTKWSACDIDSGVVSIAHVAKPDFVNTTIRHCARLYDIRLTVVLTVDVVHSVYVAKPDVVNTTR